MQKITHKDIGDYLKKAASGNQEAVDIDGGFLVTRAVVDEIVDNLKLESPLFNKARKFKLSGYGNNGLKVPYNNSSLKLQPTTGARAYWVEEAGLKTKSKVQFGVSDIQTGKLVVRIPTTTELAQDSTLLADYIIEEGTKAISNAVEYYMLRGSSTQAIKGIANAADKATLTVAVSADATEAELLAMVAKLNPIYYKTAEFYITAQQYDVICKINYTNETGLVFDPVIAKYRLFGFPVNVLTQLTADPYHVILGDFGTYGIVYKDIQIKVSDHLRYDYDEDEYRLVLRIGGDVLAENQVLDDTNTYAAFIVPTDGEAGGSSSSESSESVGNVSSSSSDSSESVGNSSSSSESTEVSSLSSESEGNSSSSSDSSYV